MDSYSISDPEKARIDEAKTLELAGAKGVQGLIEMLADSSWIVRRAVVECLGNIGELAIKALCLHLKTDRSDEARIAATVDALVASRGSAEEAVSALASDANPAVVADVAQILGRRRRYASTPILVKLIKHENDNVAVGAIEALGRIGGRAAIEALIESTQSGNFFRVFPAIDVLGRSGDPRVVEPLTQLLKNPTYLTEAARALGRSGERAAVKPLLDLLASNSDAVVRIAAVSLSDLLLRSAEKSGGETKVLEQIFKTQVSPQVVRRLARTLAEADTAEAIAICKFLGVVGNSEAAPQLTQTLDGDPVIAESAAEALKKIGHASDAHLREAIRDGSSVSRKVLLPLINRSAATEEVIKCLVDPDDEVKVLACEALTRLGAANTVSHLFDLLSSKNLRVVYSATAAIQALGSTEARTLAVAAFQSDSANVRRSALNILAYFGDSSATQPMLSGLSDADQRVKEAAIQGLPYLEDLRAIEALFESARNPNSRIRSLSMRSIGQLSKTSPRAVSILLGGIRDADSWVRYYAAQSLGRLRYTPAADEIAKLLTDEAGQVQVAAVEALSHLDSPSSHTALRAAVKSSDPDVKRAALLGLGIAGRPDDLEIILSEVNSVDAPTRLLALSALVNFSSPQVFNTLRTAAFDFDEKVRSAALGFLAARPDQEATEVMVELLSNETTNSKVKAALQISSPGRTPGLLMALETATEELAPELVSILLRMSPSQAQSGLLAAIKLSNASARKAAATGIAAFKSKPEMLEALRDAAQNDPDREVRQISNLLLAE